MSNKGSESQWEFELESVLGWISAVVFAAVVWFFLYDTHSSLNRSMVPIILLGLFFILILATGFVAMFKK